MNYHHDSTTTPKAKLSSLKSRRSKHIRPKKKFAKAWIDFFLSRPRCQKMAVGCKNGSHSWTDSFMFGHWDIFLFGERHLAAATATSGGGHLDHFVFFYGERGWKVGAKTFVRKDSFFPTSRSTSTEAPSDVITPLDGNTYLGYLGWKISCLNWVLAT